MEIQKQINLVQNFKLSYTLRRFKLVDIPIPVPY